MSERNRHVVTLNLGRQKEEDGVEQLMAVAHLCKLNLQGDTGLIVAVVGARSGSRGKPISGAHLGL
jgi:hypothetical protein